MLRFWFDGRRAWPGRLGAFFLAAAVIGCSSSEDYLPAVRLGPTDDDEEEVEAVAESETPAPAVASAEPAPAAVAAASEASSLAIGNEQAPLASAPAEPAAAANRELAPASLSAAERVAMQPIADRPDPPLSPTEQQEWTINNLRKIGAALDEYRLDTEFFPPAFYSPKNEGLLSWRVRLLPMLGYHDLYREFRLEEPWDSPHNVQLIPKIPPVYQSPERFDGRTNYLAPEGAGLVYDKLLGAAAAKMTDGVGETILVVEVDDRRAVPWTKPEEYSVPPRKPAADLGTLRSSGFLAAFAEGQVRFVPQDADSRALLALFTIAGNEPIRMADATREARVEAATAEAAPLSSPPGIAQAPATAGGGALPPSIGSAAGSSSFAAPSFGAPSTAGSSPVEAKLPVPDQATQAAAMQIVRELFVRKYEEAKTSKEKREVADQMLTHVTRLREDPVARYVVLRVARDIAADNGAVAAAQKICDQLEREYELDGVAQRALVIRKLALSLDDKRRGDTEKSQRGDLAKWAKDTIDQAYMQDDFAVAREMQQMAVSLARAAEDRDLMRDVMRRANEIESAKREYAQVAAVMKQLDDSPDDPRANTVVGRYYCFVKRHWDRGLPLLAKGDDRRLAALALQDQLVPVTPEEQVALADEWWKLSESYSEPQKAALQERAALWYRAAVARLPEGLLKIKTEMRLKAIEPQPAAS